MSEETEPIEEEGEVELELPNDAQAIEAADTAYRLTLEIDEALCSEALKARLARIRRNSLFIVDKAIKYLREVYEEEKKDED